MDFFPFFWISTNIDWIYWIDLRCIIYARPKTTMLETEILGNSSNANEDLVFFYIFWTTGYKKYLCYLQIRLLKHFVLFICNIQALLRKTINLSKRRRKDCVIITESSLVQSQNKFLLTNKKVANRRIRTGDSLLTIPLFAITPNPAIVLPHGNLTSE